MTVIGDERDLTASELMVTSLLVQATRAMVDRGRTASADGRSRSRSFRQSFLVSYGIRIGERLAGAAEVVEKDVVGVELLPVLVADRERLNQAREALFPKTVERSVAVSSYQGYAAGGRPPIWCNLIISWCPSGRTALPRDRSAR